MTHGGNGWHRGKKERLHEPQVWATLTALADSRKVWMKKGNECMGDNEPGGFSVYPRFHSPSTEEFSPREVPM